MSKKFRFGKIITVTVIAIMLLSSMLPASALSADAIPTGTPVIDGTIDSMWESASNKIDISFVNDGTDSGTKAYARLLWDKDFLYVLGVVNDSTISTTVVGTTWWGTDSLEIFLDEENLHNNDKNAISQIRVNRSGALSGMINSKAVDEAGVLASYPGTKKAAKKVSANQYVVELAIPWTRVTNVQKGNMIGIEFQLNDDVNNDGTTDCIINSEVNYRGLWEPKSYRMMTLSDVKASGSSNTSSTPTTSSKVETSSTPTTSSKVETSSTPTTSSKVEVSSKVETSSKVDTTSKDNTTVIVEETDNSALVTVVIIVGVVVLAAIVLCGVLLLRKPKK